MIERWPGDGAAYWREYRARAGLQLQRQVCCRAGLEEHAARNGSGPLPDAQDRAAADCRVTMPVLWRSSARLNPLSATQPAVPVDRVGFAAGPGCRGELAGSISCKASAPQPVQMERKMLGLGKTDFRYRIDLDWLYTLRNGGSPSLHAGPRPGSEACAAGAGADAAKTRCCALGLHGDRGGTGSGLGSEPGTGGHAARRTG